MALQTDKVLLPKEVATVITKKAKDTSTIAALSPSEPQLFLDKDYMVFSGNAEAEVIAEGEQKSSYEETLSPVVGKRFKVQTTTRVTDELRFADDDARLEIISKIQADQAAALGRVLDYVVYHAFDPKKKTTLAGFTKLSDTAAQVTATTDRVADIDALAGQPRWHPGVDIRNRQRPSHHRHPDQRARVPRRFQPHQMGHGA